MRTLESGGEKIQKICDALRHKTLEPAQKEAQQIIAEAKARGEQIILDAQKHAEQMHQEARRTIEQERNVFQSSLSQAGKQALESLRQAIEHKLFNQELHELMVKQTTQPNVIVSLIKAVVQALEKDGLAANIEAYIPANVSVKEVNQLLGAEILNKLKDKSVLIGDHAGGAKIRLENKRLLFDISNAELEDMLKQYVRKDFRKLLFAS